MKKHKHLLISILLIALMLLFLLLAVLKIIPGILLFKIFFGGIICFVANMSSGITYGIIYKKKIGALLGFGLLNGVCVAVLVYYTLILTFVLFSQ